MGGIKNRYRQESGKQLYTITPGRLKALPPPTIPLHRIVVNAPDRLGNVTVKELLFSVIVPILGD